MSGEQEWKRGEQYEDYFDNLNEKLLWLRLSLWQGRWKKVDRPESQQIDLESIFEAELTEFAHNVDGKNEQKEESRSPTFLV